MTRAVKISRSRLRRLFGPPGGTRTEHKRLGVVEELLQRPIEQADGTRPSFGEIVGFAEIRSQVVKLVAVLLIGAVVDEAAEFQVAPADRGRGRRFAVGR